MDAASLVARIRDMLIEAGVPSPEVDSEMLVGLAMGMTRSQVHLHGNLDVDRVQADRALEFARMRSRRVPLQLISGEVEFYSRRFKVRPGVFIPRPETEILIEQVIARMERESAGMILDLCTGSGVVGICLAAHFTLARVIASDISFEAVELARENAILNGVASRMGFAAGASLDFLDTEGKARGRFDAVTFNPPYVESGAIAGLQQEVRDHDPRIALDGGPDGLEYIEDIVARAASVLRGGGLLAFEIGAVQGERAAEIVASSGLRPLGTVKDLAGLDRVMLGRKPDG